jgi:GNAT superfamily N-acetyltransferase
MKWIREQYAVSDDQARLDMSMIHGFLTNCYWAKGISVEAVKRTVEHSISMGVYENDVQVGFGRAITDRTTFAYLADLFILQEHQGRGLASWLVECFLQHPELQGLRRWLLATVDAHGLYERSGFRPLQEPGRFMELGKK